MSDYEARFAHIRKGDACIYLLQEDKSRLRENAVPRCKIGKASHLDCSFKESRMQIIRSTSPEKLNLLHAIKTPSARIATKLEKLLQKRFANKKSFDYSDEWLDLDEGDTNWFCNLTYESLKENLPESIRNDIRRLEQDDMEA